MVAYGKLPGYRVRVFEICVLPPNLVSDFFIAVVQNSATNGPFRPIAVIPHDAPRLSIETEPIDIFNFQQ